jgi:hypothetical protein
MWSIAPQNGQHAAKMFARSAILVAVTVAIASCVASPSSVHHAAGDRHVASLSQFVDGPWELRIDRAWMRLYDSVLVPSDQLAEADYQSVSRGPTYRVVISDQTSRVTIGSPPLQGSRTTVATNGIVYELSENTFAGGRFVVWSSNQGLQAELTIYGSGRPIVRSERGTLARRP